MTTQVTAQTACNEQAVNNETELAKIQSTVAETFELEQLATVTADQPKTQLVAKFVDFSTKYGLGYKLTSGAVGVLFNDSTKIVTSSNLFHFVYIDRIRDEKN